MQYSPEHLKTMVYAKFGGQTECIMGNWKIENRSSVLQKSVPACSPWHAGVTGKELEIRVWQNLAQLVGGWESGTELE